MEPTQSRDGNESEQQAGCRGDDHRERHHRGIDRDLIKTRQRRRSDRHEEPEHHIGERETQRASREREDQAFEQALARDAAPAGAERRPHGEFLVASFGAGQQQVGHIGTGDEEHETDCREQHPQHLADAADHGLCELHHCGRQAGTGEELPVEAWRRGPSIQPDGHEACQVCVGLSDGCAWPQSSDAAVIESAKVELLPIRLIGQDEVDLSVEEPEARGA